MNFEIKLPKGESWNSNRLTFVEHLNSMGDSVLACAHDADDAPENGTTVMVYKADLIRAARMLGVEFDTDPYREADQ